MGRHSRAEDSALETSSFSSLSVNPLTEAASAEKSDVKLEELTPTGYHRAIGTATRRKIAAWPVACFALVLLLVLGWIGWGWASGAVNSRAEAAASQCADGDSTVKVAVTPELEKPVNTAAASWNQSKTIVGDQCIHIAVQTVPAVQVLDALSGRSNLDSIGGLPTAWISPASDTVTTLATTKPELISAPAESITTTPATYVYVGLSGQEISNVQKHAAQIFRDFLKEPAQQASLIAGN